jgi:hypothetical protein
MCRSNIIANKTIRRFKSGCFGRGIHQQLQIGNPKLAKIALDFYKYFDSNEVKKFSENISDSIKMNLSDGYECDCSRDSAIQVINHFRSSFQRIQTIPDAFVTVTFKGQPGTWVSIWGKRIAIEGGRSDTLFFNDN